MSATCADLSRSAGESLFGTASRARRWLLLEQPGAWGRDALAESDLPSEVAAHLALLARELPARILLLRRPGGERPLGTERRLYVGVSSPEDHWLESTQLAHVRDLLDVDLTPLSTGRTLGYPRVVDPLYLVCTNGRHDRCCATYGLPVAEALTEVVGSRVWECSHVGGDRFAGNLVCLPDGLFYGGLDPGTARSVVAGHEGGRVTLAHFRGRSCHPFPVQAAEALARERLGIQQSDAVRVLHYQRVDARHEIDLEVAPDRRYRVDLRGRRDDEPRRLTCDGPLGRAPRYELVRLARLPD